MALLAYGYVLFRKITSPEKTQWYLVLISTATLTLSPLIAEVIRSNFIGKDGIFQTMYLQPAVFALSLLSGFLVSLGAVFLVSQVYKRRSGFEVE